MPSLKVSLRQAGNSRLTTPRPRTAQPVRKAVATAASPSVAACKGRQARPGFSAAWASPPQRVVEIDQHIADVAPTSSRVFVEAAFQQRSDAGGHGRGMRSQSGPRDILLAVGRLSSEGRLSRQHLEAHASERPDIRALVDEVTARLLRTHVRRGAQDESVRPGAGSRRYPRRSIAAADFARPKSRIFVVPSLAILMLDGFRSRCTIPR